MVDLDTDRRDDAPSPAPSELDSFVTSGVAVCRVLSAAGVRRVYTVPGESFLELLDEAGANPGLELISTRHESGAAFMAEADAKLTGVPAVAAGTRGVGAANLAIGVHTAFQDCTPMIVLLGQVETEFAGREAFQEVDLAAFYAPITKWSATVNRADRLPELLARAIVSATTGRPGPVMLALPADVLHDGVPVVKVEQAIDAVRARHSLGAPTAPDIAQLVQAVAGARRPVAIVGSRVRGASTALVELAERLGLGVYTAFRRQDVFPNTHPHYLGHLTLGTPAPCLAALEEADVVLGLGARLDEITTQGYRYPAPHSRLIHIDVASSVAAEGTGAGWSIVADPVATVHAMLAAATRGSARDWSTAHACYLDAVTPALRPTSGAIDPAAVIEAMAKTLPGDVIVTNDAGNFSAFLHLYWKYAHGHSQLAPVSGAMGYGVPAAVAAALAGGGRPVVAVCGDGGFLMSGQEIETAVRYGLDVMVIVMRNGLYGTIAMHQARVFGRVSGVDIGPVDLAGFARSLGAHGITVSSPSELIPALERAATMTGVRLIDVVVDADLITPSARLSGLLRSGAALDAAPGSESAPAGEDQARTPPDEHDAQPANKGK